MSDLLPWRVLTVAVHSWRDRNLMSLRHADRGECHFDEVEQEALTSGGVQQFLRGDGSPGGALDPTGAPLKFGGSSAGGKHRRFLRRSGPPARTLQAMSYG